LHYVVPPPHNWAYQPAEQENKMGIYIDPHDRSKEQFLADFGVRLNPEYAENILASGTHLPVCLVDNGGGFTAAAIVYDARELYRISDPRGRKVEWWSVPVEDLVQVAPELKMALEDR
jgi:hypothetical protein